MRSLYLAALLSLPALAAGAITLTATTDAIRVTTSAAVSTDYKCSFVDNTTTTYTPGSSQGNIATATTTTVIAAPAASTQRKVGGCTLYNRSTTATQTVVFLFDSSATERHMFRAVLGPLQTMTYNEELGFAVFDSVGQRKSTSEVTSAYNGGAEEFFKTGTIKEAANVGYAWLKDVGNPGAWVPGAPGLNGATTDCSTGAGATIAGSPLFPAAATGSLYLSSVNMSSSVIGSIRFADLQWYNTGLVVTLVTAQAITFPAPVSRDDNMSNAGAGITAGIYVTVATTNAGAVTNTTLNYTNQDGVAARTGTMTSFPATAVAGTLVEFNLQAGDRGVRSIEGVTLGTSYVTGTIHLVTWRSLTGLGVPVANVGFDKTMTPGVRIANGTCIFPRDPGAAATTLQIISGVANIMER